ncbi:MAG TPA: YfbU family protein [Allosphingosinicella sp.]|jgi:hypothetical protein|nr:YfbU family protein [Allosphingosinicella sp.]
MSLTLTPAERLIVVMLAEVMEALNLRHEIDPALVKRLAINHDDWAITWQYGAIFNDEAPSEEAIQETADILDMWSFIEYSVEQLGPTEQAEIKALRWQFSGFDGNNDRHHGIAHTLIDDLGRWSEFQGRNLNSHSRATLARYRDMLPRYRDAMKGNSEPLTADQLRTILERPAPATAA